MELKESFYDEIVKATEIFKYNDSIYLKQNMGKNYYNLYVLDRRMSFKRLEFKYLATLKEKEILLLGIDKNDAYYYYFKDICDGVNREQVQSYQPNKYDAYVEELKNYLKEEFKKTECKIEYNFKDWEEQAIRKTGLSELIKNPIDELTFTIDPEFVVACNENEHIEKYKILLETYKETYENYYCLKKAIEEYDSTIPYDKDRDKINKILDVTSRNPKIQSFQVYFKQFDGKITKDSMSKKYWSFNNFEKELIQQKVISSIPLSSIVSITHRNNILFDANDFDEIDETQRLIDYLNFRTVPAVEMKKHLDNKELVIKYITRNYAFIKEVKPEWKNDITFFEKIKEILFNYYDGYDGRYKYRSFLKNYFEKDITNPKILSTILSDTKRYSLDLNFNVIDPNNFLIDDLVYLINERLLMPKTLAKILVPALRHPKVKEALNNYCTQDLDLTPLLYPMDEKDLLIDLFDEDIIAKNYCSLHPSVKYDWDIMKRMLNNKNLIIERFGKLDTQLYEEIKNVPELLTLYISHIESPQAAYQYIDLLKDESDLLSKKLELCSFNVNFLITLDEKESDIFLDGTFLEIENITHSHIKDKDVYVITLPYGYALLTEKNIRLIDQCENCFLFNDEDFKVINEYLLDYLQEHYNVDEKEDNAYNVCTKVITKNIEKDEIEK